MFWDFLEAQFSHWNPWLEVCSYFLREVLDSGVFHVLGAVLSRAVYGLATHTYSQYSSQEPWFWVLSTVTRSSMVSQTSSSLKSRTNANAWHGNGVPEMLCEEWLDLESNFSSETSALHSLWAACSNKWGAGNPGQNHKQAALHLPWKDIKFLQVTWMGYSCKPYARPGYSTETPHSPASKRCTMFKYDMESPENTEYWTIKWNLLSIEGTRLQSDCCQWEGLEINDAELSLQVLLYAIVCDD